MDKININIKGLSDSDLIDKYKSTGDYNYLGELFKRYTSFIFAVSLKYLKNKELATDAVMDIFEKLIVDLKRFKIENFKKWLHTVVKNYCLLSIRSQGYKRKFESNYKKDSKIFMENDEIQYHQREQEKETELQYLSEAIELLKKEQKKCIQLFYLEQKCYQEVSDITGYNMKQVKSYIQNGKRNLKIIIDDMKKKNKNIELLIILFMLILFCI